PGVSDYGFTPLGGGICLGGRRVTDPAADGGIAWSPDGNRVAFFRQSGLLTADVFVAAADGSHLLNLTHGSAQFSWAPDWSPDGTRIVYVASDPNVEQLVTVRPDGSGAEVGPNTDVGPTRQLGDPQWFPDGSVLGFTLTDGIHVIRPDGSGSRPLLADATGFDWSPDGRRIVFTRGDDLALAQSDGTGVSFVTRTPRLGEGAASFSPDGTKLAWVAVDMIDPKGGNDVVHGRGGNDISVGDVPFSAHPGQDRLFGGPGRDFIDSYDGRRDLVNGGPGRDRGVADRHDRVRSIERHG